MEIEKWAYELRREGNVGYEVEKIIAERVEIALWERVAKMSLWSLFWLKIFGKYTAPPIAQPDPHDGISLKPTCRP